GGGWKEGLGGEGFHRCLSADGQECRSRDRAVRRRDLAAAGSAIGGKQTEGEGVGHRCRRATLFLRGLHGRDHCAEALSKLPAPCQASSNVSSPLSNCVGHGGQPRICRSTGTTPNSPPMTA